MHESAGEGPCVHQESSTDEGNFPLVEYAIPRSKPREKTSLVFREDSDSLHRNMCVDTCSHVYTHTHTPSHNSCYSKCAP